MKAFLASMFAACLLFSAATFASTISARQVAHAATSGSFGPVGDWAAAVAGGDAERIDGFYSAAPAAQVKILTARPGAGGTLTSEEDVNFWTGLKAQGMRDLHVKMLEIQRPSTAQVSLVLRIEFSMGATGAVKPYVIEAGQAWVKEGADWKIALAQRTAALPRQAERLPEPATPNVDLYAPTEAAPREVSDALAAAAKDHKHVILVFGANWCYDCHVLDAAFHAPKIVPIVNANYHVVHVNIGEENANLDLAAKYKVPLDKGVPALAVLDAAGNVIYSQQSGEFEASVKLDETDVTGFLEKWK